MHEYRIEPVRDGSSKEGSSFRGGVVSDSRILSAILDVMEWDRCYEAATLKAMFPDISMDTLREALHALWIDRQVERVGLSGWKRYESRWDGQAMTAPTSSSM
jgi:hypothetical protein